MRLDSASGRWLLAVAVLGSGIAFLDATVVNVALPEIGRDLHASTSTLQWILNGYTLTLAALILLGGSLGDRYGRRRVFVSGTHVAMLTCAALAVAGGVLAWMTISSDLLESEPAPGGDLPSGVLHDFSCAVGGAPLRPGREAQCRPIPADSAAG